MFMSSTASIGWPRSLAHYLAQCLLSGIPNRSACVCFSWNVLKIHLYNGGIMPHAFQLLLCLNLCQHNWHRQTHHRLLEDAILSHERISYTFEFPNIGKGYESRLSMLIQNWQYGCSPFRCWFSKGYTVITGIWQSYCTYIYGQVAN